MDFDKLFEDKPTLAEWHEWRKAGIGSSDAACLHGCGYKSEQKLFDEKTSDKPLNQESNYAMERGQKFEPIARGMFADEFSRRTKRTEEFKPKNMVSDQYDFIRASLDGISNDGSTIIEIKYQGLEAHNSMEIPQKYWIQMQHQLFVSKANVCYFVSYNPDASIRLKTKVVFLDVRFINEHIEKCKAFWENVKSNQRPEAGDQDFVAVDNYNKELEVEFISTKRQIEALEHRLDEIRLEILKDVKHPKSLYGSLKITESSSQRIDYKKLIEDKNISDDELNKYRSAPSVSYRITNVQT